MKSEFMLNQLLKARYLLKNFKSYRKAKEALAMIEERYSDFDYLVVFTGALGDTCYSLSLYQAFAANHPGAKIQVLAISRYKPVVETFSIPNVAYSDHDSEFRQTVDNFIRNSFVSSQALRRGIINAMPAYYYQCRFSSRPDVLYQLQHYVYQIPGSPKPVLHQLPTCPVTCIPDFDLHKDKIIILNPYTSAKDGLSDETRGYFTEITDILTKKGYRLYTNTVGGQAPFPGSERLSCSLEELYSIAAKVSAIVSLRSGVLDFLVPAGINMFVIYNSPRAAGLFPLTSWQGPGRLTEVVRGEDVLAAFRAFAEDL